MGKEVERRNSMPAGDGSQQAGEESSSSSSTSSDETKKYKKNEETSRSMSTVPYYKLFSFADATDYALMLNGTISAAASGFCLPVMSVILGELVDSFGQTLDTKQIVHQVSKVCLKYVYLALGSGVAAFSHVICWTVTAERQAARIRSLYLRSILRQDIGFFDKEINTGEIIESLSSDTVLVQDAMGEKVGKFIQLASTFFGGFIVAFIKGWLLALVLISSIPPLVFSAAVMTIIMSKLSSKAQIAYSLAAVVVEETIGSIRTVASFTGEKKAIANYDKSLEKAYKSGLQEGIVSGLGSGAFMCVIFCSYALAVWYGSKMIIHKHYTGGDVLNVIVAILTGSFSLGQATPCLRAFAAGRVAAFKMFQTINRKPRIDPYNDNGRNLNDISGEIELRNVHFSYPSRPDEPIFQGFSLSIPSGTTVALVGQSGSGKSTVISLIERFYDPQAGQILIDGINLQEFQLRWIRGKIGLVSQEPVLFTSSIKDNIAYGKDSATIEEIKAAAQLANAATFIDRLPLGLDTMVGDHGTRLSGGQKQRIAIARAILKDPKILLLDEATSSLDVESERVVQETLNKVMINRTTVVVAHRLSTVKNVDVIAVIQQGKIVEKGSYSELLQDPEGAYSKLISLQDLNKDSEPAAIDEDKPEICVELGTYPSKRIVSVQSTSVGSSATDNGNGHDDSSKNNAKTEDAEPMAPKIPLYRLAYLNKPEIPVLTIGCVAAVVNGIILPVYGLFISSAVKIFYEPAHKLEKDSAFWASLFVVLGMTSLLVTPLRTYCFAVAGCKLIRRIRLNCFEKIVNMDISWFDKEENSVGAISARLARDVASVRGVIGDTLALIVQNSATAFAGLAIGFQASWRLALIILVMLPLIGLNGYLQMKFVSGFGGDTKRFYEEATQVASSAVGSIRTVASFCAEDKVMQLYRNKCRGPMKAGIRLGLITGTGFGLSMWLLFSAYATCFYAGAKLVEAGNTTFPQVFRVFFGLSMAAVGISQSAYLVPDSSKAKNAAASIFSVLDQKSNTDSGDEGSGATLDIVKGDIEFRHVYFRYPSRTEVTVLRGLCLAIQSGKIVAVVGESGSGKSTIISLLQRFYEIESGQIMLDGVEIEKLKLKWLRQQMGLVSQEPVLFNDTIRANIAYGKQDNSVASEAEILAAANLANAHNFISSLQQGYDTRVGEMGIQLSGGQKQRVAIARAIVKSPKILLLDEATSALDSDSEKAVQDALDRVMLDRTTVIVAHRLSTIKGADLIAVLQDGVIAELGNHQSLITINNGIYASLVALHTLTPPQASV